LNLDICSLTASVSVMVGYLGLIVFAIAYVGLSDKRHNNFQYILTI